MTENNPWRRLPESVQKDLAGPLYEAQPSNRDQDDFQKWFKQFYDGKSIDPKSVYPEWRFNHGLNHDQRNGLLCLYAKLTQDRLWDQIGGISWVGTEATMTFSPARSELALQRVLKDRGYGGWWSAKGSDDTWGLRCSLVGAELHFRGKKDPHVEVHLDLNNPGNSVDPMDGLRHWNDDKRRRATTHTPVAVRAGLGLQGTAVPDPEKSRSQSK